MEEKDIRRGVVCVWNDIDDEIAGEYDTWYQRDHLPDRFGTEGFRSSRRYIRIDGPGRQYLAFSELDSAAVGTSPAYLARLAEPTEWTQRIMRHFRRAIRYVAEVALDRGLGTGAFLGAVLYENMTQAQMEAARSALDAAFGRIVAEEACICRLRSFEKDIAGSDLKFHEQTLRPDAQKTADLTVIVEGLHERIVARNLADLAALPDLAGLSQVMGPTVYRLLFSSRQ